MLKKIVALLSISCTTAAVALPLNDSYYTGQTGQYHTLPASVDVQKITLMGKPSASCPANTLGLFAVNEYGTVEPIEFTVPSRTVFLVTDAEFDGFDNAQIIGSSAWLHIVSNKANTYERASFLSSRPLTGKANEWFEGQGSLHSGAAFATGSVLCARLGLAPDGQSSTYNMTLDSVVVHGTLIDNVRTDIAPYISW